MDQKIKEQKKQAEKQWKKFTPKKKCSKNLQKKHSEEINKKLFKFRGETSRESQAEFRFLNQTESVKNMNDSNGSWREKVTLPPISALQSENPCSSGFKPKFESGGT